MIIVKILGGLGNQMFQYAAARALAEKNNTAVKVDISDFENYDLRNYELAQLNIKASIASREEISKYKPTNSFQSLISRSRSYRHKTFFKEPFFHYDSNFFKLRNGVYLQGYFQSEKYFSSIKKVIRKEFDVSHLVSEKNKQLAHLLQQQQSVAIHIRRGDYQNSEAHEVHGILQIEYYSRAINYLKEKLQQPQFYIFSDAPKKVQAELQLPEAVIISGKETTNHFEDLHFMANCRHNVIANSSFSWWGAWLNNNPDKIVIGPKNWFNNGPKDTYDVLPESWIKI